MESTRLIVIGLICAASSLAQTWIGPVAAPQFEVASINASNPSAPRGSRFAAPPIATSPGLLTARNASLKQLIQAAFGLEDYQVSGGAGWIDSARFDIEAKPTDPADRNELLLMLRTLLADRFRLAFHREERELAVYALVVAKNGPKFHALKAGAERAPGGINRFRPRDLPFLATYLTHLGSDMPVIDKTGLTGDFDLELDLTATFEELPQTADPGARLENMFEATAIEIQDQLGLKLTPTRAPVEILVVDRAEKPNAN